MGMDRLQATRVFVRIVELGSFSAAAKDLDLHPAKVSRWVAQLEGELDVRLLERTTRALRLTDAGQRFFSEARGALDAWENAATAARDDDGEVAGRLRVSVPVVFGEKFVTPKLAAFVVTHPKLELELRFSDRYVDLVGDGFDLAVRVGRRVDSQYRLRNFGHTPRRLVAAPSFVEIHGAPTQPSDLRGLPCLLHSGIDNRVTWSFTRRGRRTRVDVGGPVRVNHSATLLELARAGQGVALLASWLVDDAIAHGELVPLLSDFAAPSAAIHALYPSARHPSLALRATLDFLADAVAPALDADGVV